MHPVIKEYAKAKATDIELGIFRARIVEDYIEDSVSVEFGSKGGWDNDHGTVILARDEFMTTMEIFHKVNELLMSIPDDVLEPYVDSLLDEEDIDEDDDDDREFDDDYLDDVVFDDDLYYDRDDEDDEQEDEYYSD